LGLLSFGTTQAHNGAERKEQETKSLYVRGESDDSKAHTYDTITTLRFFQLKISTGGIGKD